MGEISISYNLSEHNPYGYEITYLDTGKQAPDVWAIEFDDSFVENEDQYCGRIAQYLLALKPFLLDEQRTSYLSKAGGHRSDAKRILEYYKLWKTLDHYDWSGFELGAEYGFPLPNKYLAKYGAFAKFDFQEIKRALCMLGTRECIVPYSFILNVKDQNLLEYSKAQELFDLVYPEKRTYSTLFAYDVFALLECMDERDSLIQTVFCGGCRTSVVVKGKLENHKELQSVLRKLTASIGGYSVLDRAER